MRLAQPVKVSALAGVVEADETFFLRSSNAQRPGRKGASAAVSRTQRGEDLTPVLRARDRSVATADFLLDAVFAVFVAEVVERLQEDQSHQDLGRVGWAAATAAVCAGADLVQIGGGGVEVDQLIHARQLDDVASQLGLAMFLHEQVCHRRSRA